MAFHRPLLPLLALSFCLAAPDALSAAPPASDFQPSACQGTYHPFGWSEPESQGFQAGNLLELTEWVRDSRAPLLSVTISRRGRIVYELYTSGIDREAAHYVMSVTKSVTSALVGAALDRRLIGGTDLSVAALLPPSAMPDAAAGQRFAAVTLKDALGMSALDAPEAPHVKTPDGERRLREFFPSRNRLAYALRQAVLARPGQDFQYQDITPALVGGIVQYATGQSLLDFANQVLFGPMEFRHQEWMHQDPAGFDLAAYGLRLRPIDMQKFGILFLNRGCWDGKQLLSQNWVRQSFTAWIRSKPEFERANYGWYWWHYGWGPGWAAHVADGWKGQRIAILPEQEIVLTTTAIAAEGTEIKLIADIVTRFLMPSVAAPASPVPDLAATKRKLLAALEAVRSGPSRIPADAERRMIPTVAPYESHRPFAPK
jgi:CubicO group peptidase (beta-lactamase class C family)